MHPKRFPALALIAMLGAACGGGGGGTSQAPTGPAAATSAPGGTQAPTTQGPAATQAPAPTTAGNGGTARTACELLTTAEAATALGTGELAQTGGELAGQTFCDYRDAAGGTVLTSYMQAAGAAQLWSVYESSLVTEPVAGIGDKAMFEPSTKLLFVLKGDAFFNVFIADVSLSPEQALEQEKKVAQIMVGRL